MVVRSELLAFALILAVGGCSDITVRCRIRPNCLLPAQQRHHG